jgi:hypothetical protein
VNIPCKLCEKRRARRHCPGVEGEICSQCCGSQREITIECPASCEYLKEARFHEQPPAVTEDQVPNPDIRLSEKFLRDTEPLVFTLAVALKRAMESGGAVISMRGRRWMRRSARIELRQTGLFMTLRAESVRGGDSTEAAWRRWSSFRRNWPSKGDGHGAGCHDVLGVLSATAGNAL